MEKINPKKEKLKSKKALIDNATTLEELKTAIKKVLDLE